MGAEEVTKMARCDTFRIEAAKKYLSRGRGKVETLRVVNEIGVSERALRHWVHKYGMASEMPKSKRRPQDWSAGEKFKAVMEFETLAEDKRGEFLRSKGLQSEHLEMWKQTMQNGLKSVSASRPESGPEKLKIKALEKELAQKDKVIAETTALLVLKKKANSIWGTGENE